MNTTPTETLFTCPNCGGYHFNIGVGGTLVCTNKRYRASPDGKGLDTDPCGWRGCLPSEEPTKTIEPLPELGGRRITLGAPTSIGVPNHGTLAVLDRRVTPLPTKKCFIEIFVEGEWFECDWNPRTPGSAASAGYLGTARTTNKPISISFNAWEQNDSEFRYFCLPTDLGNPSTTTPQIQIRTAEQAREAVEQVVRKEFQEEFREVEEAIQKATQFGHSGASIPEMLNNKVIRTLESLGYRVTGHTAEPYETRISW